MKNCILDNIENKYLIARIDDVQAYEFCVCDYYNVYRDEWVNGKYFYTLQEAYNCFYDDEEE